MKKTGFRNTRLHAQIITGILAGVLVGFADVLDTGTVAGALCILVGMALFIFLKFKYDFCVYLDIFLLSIAIIEPSPSDILFIALMMSGIFNKALELGKIKRQPLITVIFLAYLLVSLFGIILAVDLSQAVKFYFVTFYLLLFCFYIFLYLDEYKYVSLIRAYIASAFFTSILGFIGFAGFFSNILLAYENSRVKALF